MTAEEPLGADGAAPAPAAQKTRKRPLSAYMLFAAKTQPTLRGLKVVEQAHELARTDTTHYRYR